MAAVITVSNATIRDVDNTQKLITVDCFLTISGSPYTPGGIPLDAVLLAIPGVTTNSGIKYTDIKSEKGSGYLFQRISSAGTLMILQLPPNGSLTTAGPLQEIPASTNLQGIQQDTIACRFCVLRNS